jgi:competence protein ComEA
VPDPNAPRSRLDGLRRDSGLTPDLTPDPGFWGAPGPRDRTPSRRAGGARVDSPFDALRDRFETWRSDARFGVIALVVIAVIAGVIWYRVGVSGGDTPIPATAVRTPSPTAGGVAPVTTSTSPTRLVVHVAGDVTHPGVVELPPGSRVIDAIEAAGGGRLDADLDRLNLAAKVADGDKVLVQKVGDPTAPADPSGTTSAVPGTGSTTGLVNLNTATQAQLEELPGIGPSFATAIISEREKRGGFKSVNELREVRGIGEKRFADLRNRVTV